MPPRRINIMQGEHCVMSDPQVIITTLLGSCVAVCLYDSVAHVGGINHFLLPQPRMDTHVEKAEMQRYGVHAMELLINEMMKIHTVSVMWVKREDNRIADQLANIGCADKSPADDSRKRQYPSAPMHQSLFPTFSNAKNQTHWQ